jgi:tRNA-(ms[2]io[6]A)-hydroxylase
MRPVLSLAAPTTPEWTARVLAHVDEILVDHAHCEKKAAGSAVNLIFRYPEHGFLHEPLSRLAREELVHFERVLGVLARRGVAFRRQRPSPYAGRLKRAVRPAEPGCLLDTLLCCALIEARSCERFGLLAEALPDPALAAFYRELLASEARHHQVYVGLAEGLAPRDAVRARLAELALHEASVLADAPDEPRLHN